tara:strand:- start:96 stop:533 length:438 start_codon:yes stop_codon:yes gene_type:complete
MVIEHVHSVLFAQVIGTYLIILSIIMLAKTRHYRDAILRVDPYSPSIFFAGAAALLLGCFMIVVHNVWVLQPRVVVTVLGWIVFVKSILWLSFPVFMCALRKKIVLSPMYYILVFVLFVVGVFLFTRGFYLHIPEEHLMYTLVPK